MIKVGLSNKYKVDPYGTEEILSEASVSLAPKLTIDYGDEVQEAEFTIRPTKGSLDTNISPGAVLLSIKGNTSVVNDELVSCKMSALKTVGFNQWDGTIVAKAKVIDNTNGNVKSWGSSWGVSDYIRVIPNCTYYINGSISWGSGRGAAFYDINKNYVSGTIDHNFVIPSNAHYIRFSIMLDNLPITCLNFSSAKDGQYESYKPNFCNIPVTTLKGKLNGGSSVVVFPDGIKSAGDVRDEIKVEDNLLKGIKRVDTRAYESGDVNSSTMTTDGANYTNYALTTPEEYIIDDVSVEKIMLGSTEATKVYLGNQLIFEESD